MTRNNKKQETEKRFALHTVGLGFKLPIVFPVFVFAIILDVMLFATLITWRQSIGLGFFTIIMLVVVLTFAIYRLNRLLQHDFDTWQTLLRRLIGLREEKQRIDKLMQSDESKDTDDEQHSIRTADESKDDDLVYHHEQDEQYLRQR